MHATAVRPISLPEPMPRSDASEMRRTLRRDVDLAARYRFGQESWAPCRVRNISAMGALIVFEREATLPDVICLQVPADLVEVTCFVHHQNGHRAGLMFLDNCQATLAKYG